MGVFNLWQALGAAVHSVDGITSHAKLLQHVEEQRVAVDLSAWLMQAKHQTALVAAFDSDAARCKKVVFERCIHLLKYGCVPVIVVEGRSPEQKRELLKHRHLMQHGYEGGGGGNVEGGFFDQLGQEVVELLAAMGLPTFQAPGEAEAACAALNRAGLVDAVATHDSDALLFGAETVFRTLHLQTADPRKSHLDVCSMDDVRAQLGITAGGQQALLALAQLAGGDYDSRGADRVGTGLALKAVKQLLNGRQDDFQLLDALEAALTAGPDPHLAALTKCTGCSTCRHAKHGRKACPTCGCSTGCVARPRSSPCECEFHMRETERWLNKVIERACNSSGFMERCRTALGGYQQQAALASREVAALLQRKGAGYRFEWERRPDVALVATFLQRDLVKWDYSLIRNKVLPLLVEWDLKRGAGCKQAEFVPRSIKQWSFSGCTERKAASAPAVAAAVLQRSDCAPATIATPPMKARRKQQQQQQPSRSGSPDGTSATQTTQGAASTQLESLPADAAAQGGKTEPWRYVLVLERTPHVADGAHPEDVDADKAWLAHRDSIDDRTVRQRVLQQGWPQLVQEFEARLEAAATRKAKPPAGRAAGGSRTSKGSKSLAAAATQQMRSSMAQFLKGPRPAAAASQAGSMALRTPDVRRQPPSARPTTSSSSDITTSQPDQAADAQRRADLAAELRELESWADMTLPARRGAAAGASAGAAATAGEAGGHSQRPEVAIAADAKGAPVARHPSGSDTPSSRRPALVHPEAGQPAAAAAAAADLQHAQDDEAVDADQIIANVLTSYHRNCLAPAGDDSDEEDQAVIARRAPAGAAAATARAAGTLAAALATEAAAAATPMPVQRGSAVCLDNSPLTTSHLLISPFSTPHDRGREYATARGGGSSRRLNFDHVSSDVQDEGGGHGNAPSSSIKRAALADVDSGAGSSWQGYQSPHKKARTPNRLAAPLPDSQTAQVARGAPGRAVRSLFQPVKLSGAADEVTASTARRYAAMDEAQVSELAKSAGDGSISGFRGAAGPSSRMLSNRAAHAGRGAAHDDAIPQIIDLSQLSPSPDVATRKQAKSDIVDLTDVDA